MFREEVAAYYRKRGYAIKENVKVRSPDGTVYAVDMVAQSTLGNLLIAFEDEGGFEGPEMNAVRRMAREIGATPVVAAKVIPDGLRKRAAGAGVVLLDEETLHAPEPEDDTQNASTEPEYPPWPGSDQDDEAPPPWPRTAGARARMEARDLDSIVADLSQEAVQRRKEKSTDPGIWRFPRQGAEPPGQDGPENSTDAPAAAKQGFTWLPKEQQEAMGAVVPASAGPQARQEEPPRDPGTPAPGTTKQIVARPQTNEAATPKTPAWIYVVMAAVFGATGAGVLYALMRLLG